MTPDERLCRAGWCPRYRSAAGGYDYWQACTTGESAGLADTFMGARRLALARLQ